METQRNAKLFGIRRLTTARFALLLCGLFGSMLASAGPLVIQVVGVGPDGAPVQAPAGYRWTVEEDATKLSVPGKSATTANYSFSFHTSYMPVLAAGRVGTQRDGVVQDPDVARLYAQPLPQVCPSTTGGKCMDPAKRYYVSVAAEGFQMGGAPVVFSGTGTNASATVYLNQYPVPTAQVSVFAFNDNSPINGAPDLPQETGLEGFTVQLIEAGGTYGASGGAVTQDGFGNPLGTTYNADGSVKVRGSGIIRTGPDGTAVIKNLFPAKYTVFMSPPVGSDWVQTSTIEGTKGSDAWVKNNEPSFFQEFGPPGHHVFLGFTHRGKLAGNRANGDACQVGTTGCTAVLSGTKTITGRVVNIHNSRTPNYNFEKGAPVTECWVGLNETGGGTRALYAAACKKDSTFTIPNVPAGNYELVIWDEPLDMIIGTQIVTLASTTTTLALGDVPVFSWFGRYQGRVFQDIDGSGLPFFAEPFSKPYIKVDPVTGRETEEQKNYLAGDLKPAFGEGLANNIRFRDGSIYQSVVTKPDGTFAFTEVFPFFNWMIAEADYARFKATGATIVGDAGGLINPTANASNLWAAQTGSFGSNDPAFAYNPWIRLNPQVQATCSAQDVLDNKDPNGKIIDATGCIKAGDKHYRTEQGVILLEGMQTFLGQTNHIEWGKQPYAGQLNGPKNENGGIAGIVHYAITRAEDDPRFAAPENWEPGVPRVQVDLFLDCDGDGKIDKPANDGTGQCVALSTDTTTYPATSANPSGGYVAVLPDVDNYPYCWRDPESCGATAPQKGPEDYKRNTIGSASTFSYGDVFAWGGPDTSPTGQLHAGLGKTDSWDDAIPTGCVRPPAGTVGNGGIPFAADLDCFDGLYNFNQVVPAVFDGGYGFGRVAGQAELPVYIGSTGKGTYIVEAVAPPGYLHQGNGDKNVVFGDELQASTAALPFACVGMELPVPENLTLFPGEPNPNYAPGKTWRKCDMKAVPLLPGANPAPDFYLFTEAPVAAHGVGFILDDTASEFNRFAPTFGEKYAPPHLPVSVQDWTGRELTRVYSDQFGSYNFLTPSSFTINPPFPSGVMPNMIVSCMNHPGPIDDTRVFLADGVTPNPTFGKKIIDPFFNRKYTQFCYTLQFLAGKTTYMDTPVLPIAAFATVEKNPLDCECQDQTPAIYSVNNADSNTNSGNNGPWVPATGGVLTIVSAGKVEVPNPAYDPTLPGSPKLIVRDYGFGAGGGTVRLGNTTLTVAGAWNADILQVNVPAGTASGQQLSITRNDSGKESVVGLTVHVGGSAPIVVQPGASIQAVIDASTTPVGALITIPPGTYNEYLILDKRVRLQGWGANSVGINASKASAGGLAAWRARINAKANVTFDLLPGQTLGIDAANNEPLLFGAEEGPGILAVGKMALASNGSTTCANAGVAFRIDGVTVTGSDSGGGILASGYNCNLQITNNRVVGNYGTFGGGIRVGHTALASADVFTPGINTSVVIANNWVSQNGASEIATGDGGGGGVTLGTGSDNYMVRNNYVCGNFSMSDGGGISHVGLSGGTSNILNNKILLNQTFNQAADPTGGGLFVGGQVPVGGGTSTGTGDINIDRNLIQYNHAGAGAGGGVSVVRTVGTDDVVLTNNMIVNNATAYAGGGVAVADVTTSVRLVNNTVADNASTATNRQSFPAGPKVQSTPQIAGIARVSGPSPTLLNNIVFGNRSFAWSITPTDANLPQTTALTDAGIWDLGVVGDTSHTALTSNNSVLTDGAGNNTANGGLLATTTTVAFVKPIRFLPLTDTDQPVALPETTIMQTALTFDEGGNFINVNFSPLTPWDIGTTTFGAVRADYHLQTTSVAVNAGTNATAANRVPGTDYDGQARPSTAANRVDVGADEVASGGSTPAGTSSLAFTAEAGPGTLSTILGVRTFAFGNVGANTVNTLTVTAGGATPSVIGTITVTGARFTLGTNTCTGQTLVVGATCTIQLRFDGSGGILGVNPSAGVLAVPSNSPASPTNLVISGS